MEKQVTITSLAEEPFTINDISSTIDDMVAYQLETVQKEKKYLLTIKTRTGIENNFRGKILVKTSNTKKPEITISVTGSVKKGIKAIPEYLYFGIIDTGKKELDPKSLERTTVLNPLKGERASISKIDTSKEWITASATTSKDNKRVTITIQLDKKALPKGNFREQVTIHAEFGNKPEVVTVILEGKVI